MGKTDKKVMVVLESPGKIKKVQSFLGSMYIVKASIGHILSLQKKDGVDKENGFEPKYVISEDKKDVVKDLISTYKSCGDIILLTDMDLEGEKIAFDVCKVLGIIPEKTKRGVTVEITEKGVKNAVDKPGVVNLNKVYAQQSRRIVDRLFGYDASGLVISKIQKGLSAGRVQSVATLIIVERENEINKFESSSDFKVFSVFEVKDKKNKLYSFKATLNKRFKSKDEARSFLEKSIDANYIVKNIETKQGKRSAPAPFTTSSIQQEGARKFGFTVDRTMQILQKCYEQGWTTYMRTDSVSMSQEALDGAKNEIINLYGKNYSNPRQFQSKKENAANAHECIRPTHFENQTVEGTDDEKKMYDLVWKRTMASQMSDAIIDRTSVTVSSDKVKEEFIGKGEFIRFDGFLKIYKEGTDNEDDSEDDDSAALPQMEKGQELKSLELLGNEMFTKPSARYTQASLVKRMEELGIGRPSTYASTIKTITDRGYVEIKNLPAKTRDVTYLKLIGKKIDETIKIENFSAETKKMFPTDIGRVLTEYLVATFPNIINYKFTANIESELDKIESGDKIWNEMIKEFYEPFTETLKIAKGNTDKPGSRLLGVHPENGLSIYARLGRFGPMIQMGEAVKQEKSKKKDAKESKEIKSDVKFGKIPEGLSIETITLQQAIDVLSWPKNIGEYKSLPVLINNGKFGPYVKYADKFHSIKEIDINEITLKQAIEIINGSGESKSGGGKVKEFKKEGIVIMNGQYGHYFKYKNKNYKIPEQYSPEKITADECFEIIKNKPKSSGWKKKKKE